MKIINVEFKARVADSDLCEQKLLALNPVFKGLDEQTDTYFKVPIGRLKLREGRIENALIQYDRQNIAGAKQSDVILYQHQPDPALKKILELQFGILKVVSKQRKIYFIGNVKFHFDKLKGLGDFIEVEAIAENGERTPEQLKEQCNQYASFFGISEEQYVEGSYSDMI